MFKITKLFTTVVLLVVGGCSDTSEKAKPAGRPPVNQAVATEKSVATQIKTLSLEKGMSDSDVEKILDPTHFSPLHISPGRLHMLYRSKKTPGKIVDARFERQSKTGSTQRLDEWSLKDDDGRYMMLPFKKLDE